MRAIRYSVAVSRLADVHLVRLTGESAWEALDHLCPGDLYVRDGQLLHTLLLGDDGTLFADCYAGRDDEDYFLLAEGPDAAALAAHLARHVPPGVQWSLAGDVTLLGLDGPFAWELLAAVAGAQCVGLPYLTFFHHERWLIWRAGKTGEFGYGIVARRDEADALEATLLDRGRALDAARADRAVLDQCALENGFFNIRREGRSGAGALELQLSWRLSSRKSYVGSEAIARQRAAGLARRITTLVSPGPLAPGDELRLGAAPVGRVVNAGPSPLRGDVVGLALVDIAWAHPGLAFTVGAGAVPAWSVSPPVIDNVSLHVSPQAHSYATRPAASPSLARRSP